MPASPDAHGRPPRPPADRPPAAAALTAHLALIYHAEVAGGHGVYAAERLAALEAARASRRS
jgi:hypothetical protein